MVTQGIVYIYIKWKYKILKKATYRESVPSDNQGECVSHVLPALREIIVTSYST